jgi:hypothetical protein
MTTIARGNTLQYLISTARTNQALDQLESFLLAALGSGVVSGGLVTTNGGLSIKVASGTVFAAQGVTLTLGADAVYNGCADNTVNTLWGRILRTAADPTHPADLDTYVLSLTSNTTDVTPGADYFRLAKITTLGGAAVHFQNACLGKFIKLLEPWRLNRKRDLAAGDQQYVGAGEQFRWRGPVTLAAGSELYIEAGGSVVID